MTRRSLIAAAAVPLMAARRGGLDFAALIPDTIPRSCAFRDEGFHIWDPAMVRTPDGVCHLLYSRWPVKFAYDAWATNAEIAWATASAPEGLWADFIRSRARRWP